MENNRITLQYSIEEKDLKFEAHRLICNSLNRLTSIVCEEPPVNTVLTMATVDEINSLRAEIAKIDIALNDAAIIVENYIDYKHQQRMASVMTPDLQSDDPLNLDALKTKIDNFRDKLDTHENTD